MRMIPTDLAGLRRAAIAAAVCAAALSSAPAAAQQVLVIVNGDPITSYDVDQRSKFIQLTTHKPPGRQEVIDELINEKLKVQFGKRYKFEVPDKEVDNAYADIGKRMRMTPQQFTQALAQAGVDAETLKSRLRSDYAWQAIVRSRYQSSLQINEREVLQALETRKKDDSKQAASYEYQLRPILFLVPKGSPETDTETRKKEAEALRARFNNCDEGLPVARSLRNVIVREPIKRNSADLAPVLRQILDETPVGHLTNPEVTAQGVETFALCSRNENKEDSVAKREVREEIFAEQFKAKSIVLLQELRRSAMIEVK